MQCILVKNDEFENSSHFIAANRNASSDTNHDTTVTTCGVPLHCVWGKNFEFEHRAYFSEDARNMVGQRTASVVRVFGKCSENAPLQYMSCGIQGYCYG